MIENTMNDQNKKCLSGAIIYALKHKPVWKIALWATAAVAIYSSTDLIFPGIGAFEMVATKLSVATIMGLSFLGSTAYPLEK